MIEITQLVELAIICITALMTVFVIALSMPQSKFREVTKSMLVALICFIYVVSPIDLMPEIVVGPFGLVDDIGMAVIGVATTKQMLRTAAKVGQADPKNKE